MEFNIINMMYAALPRHNRQKRGHFYAKTTSAKLYIYIGVGSRDLFIEKAHTALDIFRFAVFFPCMLPTPLCGIFGLWLRIEGDRGGDQILHHFEIGYLRGLLEGG